jgi:hypothetical protein
MGSLSMESSPLVQSGTSVPCCLLLRTLIFFSVMISFAVQASTVSSDHPNPQIGSVNFTSHPGLGFLVVIGIITWVYTLILLLISVVKLCRGDRNYGPRLVAVQTVGDGVRDLRVVRGICGL